MLHLHVQAKFRLSLGYPGAKPLPMARMEPTQSDLYRNCLAGQRFLMLLCSWKRVVKSSTTLVVHEQSFAEHLAGPYKYFHTTTEKIYRWDCPRVHILPLHTRT